MLSCISKNQENKKTTNQKNKIFWFFAPQKTKCRAPHCLSCLAPKLNFEVLVFKNNNMTQVPWQKQPVSQRSRRQFGRDRRRLKEQRQAIQTTPASSSEALAILSYGLGFPPGRGHETSIKRCFEVGVPWKTWPPDRDQNTGSNDVFCLQKT